MPKIFGYLDYRKFVSDSFEELQRADPKLSLRLFCKKAGFSSTGMFRFIVTGKRNLTSKSSKKLSRALRLTSQEESFFGLLIDFAQAQDAEGKKIVYEKILTFKPYQGARPLEREQYYYYSSWLVSTLREMVGLEGFKEDPEWLAKKLLEPTRASDIKAALQMLINLGLIVRDPQTKRLRQADAKVSSPELVRGICYLAYFRAVSLQAVASIERSLPEERELSAMTLSLSEERLQSLKSDLLKFKSEIFEKYGEAAAGDDRVCQINLQLFPMTSKI